MERIYKYITLLGITLMAIGCINSELTPDIPSAECGDEVKFGLSLQNPDTKTVYGSEYEYTDDDDKQQFAFPIYWVDGDKVQIFSPQCLTGRRSAEYKVILPNDQDDKGNPIPPYYADDLVRTGEYGVQWGDSEIADFYSLYPSGNYTLSSDGTKAENIVINYNQNIVVNGDDIKSDMADCLMYAKTDDVTRGTVVNLQYDPISTVIYVTLKVAAGTGATEDTQFTIQSISLHADTEIAGTFSLNISDGTFGEFVQGKSSSTVLAQITNPSTGGFHTISNGESISVPLFLAPISSVNVKDWEIQVVANNKTYTKTLNINKTLEPGQIHKITLPDLPVASENWTTNNWMTNIPRNVYLSEVSLPGSWNSLNSHFQGANPSIESQFNKGVRAFHLEARWSTTASPKTGWLIDDYYLMSQLGPENMYLSVADGHDGRHVYEGTTLGIPSGDKEQIMVKDNPSFESYLKQITDKIIINSKEYMVLICSFAQGSFNDTDITGKTWMQAISDVCAKNDYVLDSRTLSSDTMVGDVLGKVLVIVNLESQITSSTELPENSKCMFTYMPSNLTAGRFTAESDELLLQNNEDQLWCSSDKVMSSDITIYNNQAQLTSSTNNAISHNERGYVPTLAQRENTLNKLLEWSKSNYGTAAYAHNKWLYLGLGGYQVSSASQTSAVSNSYETIAKRYNKWINDKIILMGSGDDGNETPYYPVGIVLMNYVTDDEAQNLGTAQDPLYTTEVVQNILLLNNKYQLQYNPDYPTDYTPNLLSAGEYGSSATHGGNAISLD